MNRKELDLYNLYTELMTRQDDGKQQRVVIYHPDEFIKLAEKNLELTAEVDRLKRVERKYCDGLLEKIHLIDKLRWCGDMLEKCKIEIPFEINSNPMY